MAKKRRKARRRKPLLRRKAKNRMVPMARRIKSVKRDVSRARRRATGLKPMFNKVAKGLGYAAIAGLAINAIAPQYKEVGQLAAAFYGGGLFGAGAQFLVSGAQLPQIPGLALNGSQRMGATF